VRHASASTRAPGHPYLDLPSRGATHKHVPRPADGAPVRLLGDRRAPRARAGRGVLEEPSRLRAYTHLTIRSVCSTTTAPQPVATTACTQLYTPDRPLPPQHACACCRTHTSRNDHGSTHVSTVVRVCAPLLPQQYARICCHTCLIAATITTARARLLIIIRVSALLLSPQRACACCRTHTIRNDHGSSHAYAGIRVCAPLLPQRYARAG
jgi:hypothetical protein